MNTKTILFCVSLLAGCGDYAPPMADQCLRAELFKQCMAALPAGPTATHYNDWSEVVNQCSGFAYSASIRARSQIKNECKP